MNLFFLRHGKAEPRSPKWRPDSKRPLTKDGERRMAEVARGARAMDLTFDLILTSPYVRAYRTAEILADVYGEKKLLKRKASRAMRCCRALLTRATRILPSSKTSSWWGTSLSLPGSSGR